MTEHLSSLCRVPNRVAAEGEGYAAHTETQQVTPCDRRENPVLWIKEIEIRNVLVVYDLGELEGYGQPATASGMSQSLSIRMSRGKRVLKRYKYSLNLEVVILREFDKYESLFKDRAPNGTPLGMSLTRKSWCCVGVLEIAV